MADQRHLRAAKLKGLVRTHTGQELIVGEALDVVGGLILVEDGVVEDGVVEDGVVEDGVVEDGVVDDGVVEDGAADNRGPVGYFYASADDPTRMLGPALIWADRAGAAELHVLADAQGGQLARRAAYFSKPTIVVHDIVGSELIDAAAVEVVDVPTLGADEWAFAGLISDTGARPVDDHGRLVAEVAGLEVARVVRRDDEVAIDVGVGQADRELHGLVHSNMDADTALRRAISAVLEHRRPGAPMHPLNRMARERWLRSLLLDDPSLIEAADLTALPPLRPRETVLGNVPCAAAGPSLDGGEVVVVCSVGVDPDLMPEAADFRNRHDPEARLVVVVPERDRYRVAEDMVRRLDNAELRSIPTPW